MKKKSSVDVFSDSSILGKSVKQAKEMVQKDRACVCRGSQNEKYMKKHGISVADMAGFMH